MVYNNRQTKSFQSNSSGKWYPETNKTWPKVNKTMAALRQEKAIEVRMFHNVPSQNSLQQPAKKVFRLILAGKNIQTPITLDQKSTKLWPPSAKRRQLKWECLTYLAEMAYNNGRKNCQANSSRKYYSDTTKTWSQVDKAMASLCQEKAIEVRMLNIPCWNYFQYAAQKISG